MRQADRPAVSVNRRHPVSASQRWLAGLMLIALGASAPARAEVPSSQPVIALSASATVSVANDLAVAQAYFETTDPDPARVADIVNARIDKALTVARDVRAVKIGTRSVSTSPIYAKADGRIEGWRMRATVQLESTDFSALSALLGQLQAHLVIASLGLQLTDETREAAIDEASLIAIQAFEQRAVRVAKALGGSHRLLRLDIQPGGVMHPMPIARRMHALAAAPEAIAPAIEAGEQNVSVHVQGEIALAR